MLDRHLGNFLVASPVLAHIARHNPTRSVINDSFQALARRIPGFPEPCARFPSRAAPRWQRATAFLSALRTIRAHQPEWLADFGGSNSGALLSGLSGAPMRICRKRAPRAWLYNRLADFPPPEAHRIAYYGALAEAAGFEGPWGRPEVVATAEDLHRFEQLRLPDLAQIVCLHVAGGKSYKHWPVERYAALSDWLSDQGLSPALVGAAPDRAAADRMLAHCTRPPLDLVARLELGPLIALFQRCGLFVGNDSGPMHLAAAAGAPIVALFGPTDPRRWGPLSERAVIVRGTEPVPPGEGKKSFADGRRMDSITVEQVRSAVVEQLTLAPGGR
ncbi:glycosyl transferase, family 9 [Alkalilimnicola ehrlichii MLHE-1]|uniref:Glycosyl transferase, family 9 n=2 Tax=Alkalilimnicola ehrlichii TaxID=351052 RepID=Q0A4V0_ALKEH|nr:glycosyl transferase, family 9 [Alkalilimnicola ehrlichii MLHE-1]